LTQLTNDFRGDALDGIASGLGESPAKTQGALGAVLPALLGGLALKAATHDRAGNLLDLIKTNRLDTVADATNALKAPGAFNTLVTMGRPLMDSIFGTRSAALSDWAASRSGISRSSSSSLFSLALPIVLGLIARRVNSAGWSASNLMSLLDGERAHAPAGLSDILRADDTAAVRHERTYDTADVHRRVPIAAAPTPKARSSWLWALPLLFLIPLLGYFMSRHDEPRREAAVQTVPAPRAEVPRAIPERESPVGTTGTAAAPPARIESYQIQFRTASPALTAESSKQLRSVVDYLKTHPQAKVAIVGYTDSAGNDAANLRLSQKRATAVMNLMASRGIEKSRMTAEGYGERDPVADNSTREGRLRNRRVEINVTND
jgi:outer membrane protein OmpA-like peptidoglycan-associated protein